MFADLKRRSMKGFAWAAGESLATGAISLVTFVILARLLDPQDFGIVALATVFIHFCNLLAGHIFADAIIQRRHVDPLQLDTAFWSTIGISAALAAGCVAAADPAASLLNEPRLGSVLGWLSLSLPLAAASSVQMALFRRDMKFGAVARRTLAGRLLGATVGITMALADYGLWSLVAQQLVGQLATMLAFMLSSWRPRLRFSPTSLRETWSFGLHVSASQIVAGAGEQALVLAIGSLFGSTTLGYFIIAWRTVQIIRSLISSAVYHVGLSAFSKLQDDHAAVGAAFLNATRLSCLAGFPLAAGMALVATPLILTAFDDKWHASAPILLVLALELVPGFYGMFLSALYRAMNRPGWSFAMASTSTFIGLGGVLAAAPFGLQAVVTIWVVRAFVLMPVHVALVSRLLAMAPSRLMGPATGPLAATAVMSIVVAIVDFALPENLPSPAILAVLATAGILTYSATVRMLCPDLVRLAVRSVSTLATPARRAS